MVVVYILGFMIGLFFIIRKRNLDRSAVVLLVGSIIAACLWTAQFLMKDQKFLSEIARSEKSGKKQLIELDAESAGDRRSLQIEVLPQEYSENELKDLCKSMWNILEKEIPAENHSLDYVTKDLFFPEKFENYPFTIRWKSSKPELLSETGKIGQGINREGTLIEVCAHISVEGQNFEEEHLFYVHLFPSNDKECYWKRLEETMKGVEESTRSKDVYVLPENFEGNKIRFYKKKENTDSILFFFTVIGTVAIHSAQKHEKEKLKKQKSEAIEREYPEMVSRMAMLIGAGMTVSGSFQRIAEDYAKRRENNRKPLYEELLKTCREIESGVSEKAAYRSMGARCGSPCVMRFTALLIQFTKSGGYGLKAALQEETDKAFAERKERAKRLGEEAGTKLLVPMVCMLLLVMVIVMVPAFTSFGTQ